MTTVTREAHTTPTKLGQFVTVWLRSDEGPIRPYSLDDQVETFVITAEGGQFVFPVEVLHSRGIVSGGTVAGKRAFRVYPPSVAPTSAQALSTQRWQLEYFVASS